MKKQLGCLSGSGIITAVLVIFGVGGALWLWGGAMFSPGPLNAQTFNGQLGGVATHAELGNRCAACHVAPWSADTLSDRCLVCHTATAAELTDPATLHGAMLTDGFLPCQECHTDHNGPTAAMTVVDPDRFPHTIATGYALDAHHEMSTGETLECAACHGDTLTDFDAATCDTCHRDLDAAFTQAHVDAFGPDCIACHDGLDSFGAAWTHDLTGFPLDGAHTQSDCTGCHAGQQTLVALQGTEAACAACHAEDDAHAGAFGQDCAACHATASWEEATFSHAFTAFPLTGAHEQVACELCHINEVFAGTPTDCYGCHQADDAHAGGLGQQCEQCHITKNWRETLFTHALTDFPLLGAHAAVPCIDCHLDNVFEGTPESCAGCHQADDVHGGGLGQQCDTCHTTATWSETLFTHALTDFPLLGAHAEVACEQCHLDNVFDGTPTSCYGCHATDDTHRGTLGQQCEQCHNNATWQDVVFNHALTNFPLTGAHQQTPCEQCHIDLEFGETPTTCRGCHNKDDVHKGSFGPDCETCHTTTTWEGASFDHSRTAFPLTGAHATTTCTQCHVNNVYQGTPTQCFACHAADDAHNGQYGQECEICHTSSAWKPAAFTGPHTFPINHGASQNSPCSTCHPTSLTSYTCYGCHEHTPANIAGEHREEGITNFDDCFACHPDGREHDD
ncbi:MAG: hypothetical protein Kow0031_17650 [Anaerolineae bacterium]